MKRGVLGLWLALVLTWVPGVWAASEVRFAVVRATATENDPQWLPVRDSLRNLSYRTIPASQLNALTLQGVAVLFLPNVDVLLANEVQAITEWANRGGRLIVSGPLAPNASLEVQQQLQQLVGVTWSSSLDLPVALKLVSSEPTWQRSERANSVEGAGTLTNLGPAVVVANWDTPQTPAAVLSTERVTYLGWQWGQSANMSFDRSWLSAAVERHLPGFSRAIIKIAPVEILTMRQELTNLLGRIENIASASRDPLSPTYRNAVAQAHQTLARLPKLIQQGEDAQAKVLWESAVEGLWRNYPIVPTNAPPEVRAIWLDRGTIVQAGSPEGLRRVFDLLAQAGINTVFFETLNAGYTIYPSRVAFEQNPLTQGWDPLAAAVTLAHERKMELHAWCWTFAVGNSRHNRLVNQPETYPGPVLSRRPEWGMTDNQGSFRPRGQNEYWIDPANIEARNYLSRIHEEILTTYAVDGLQLDYIRYPFQGTHSFGYSQTARVNFRAIHGVDPLVLSPSKDISLIRLWNQFKARQVSDFVAAVSSQTRRRRPEVLLSAAVYPYENRERLTKLQQDWESWARQGQVDMLVPMTYKLNTRALQQEVEPILNPVEQLPVLFLPSVNLQDLPQIQLRDQIQAVRDLPSSGYSLFAAAHLNTELDLVLRQATSVSALIPHRQPLKTVQERFDLQAAEWEALLKDNRIVVDPNSITLWRSGTRKLQQQLKDMADRPTVPKIRQARASITEYRADIQKWLKAERFERAYRNQTWDNRLAAMDSLLRYGELVFPRLLAGP
ncbi:glycoside hydrolase family 10 protein [Candidatus Cyanaurora vandensis]|uniref:glycoside hydrolase family 10 protein n=1 Tax=Candidatus Cyanaurora vandensis TaxID=2714958 RepID=UPI002580A1A8|nr:family 10 glycosylhydrolase [Candidatus Cyanaurora vandensis]